MLNPKTHQYRVGEMKKVKDYDGLRDSHLDSTSGNESEPLSGDYR